MKQLLCKIFGHKKWVVGVLGYPCCPRCGLSMDTTKVTRVEVIDHTKPLGEGGIVYNIWDDTIKVEVQLQDDGRTLKVFVTK